MMPIFSAVVFIIFAFGVGFAFGVDHGERRVLRQWRAWLDDTPDSTPTSKREGELR